MSDNVGLLWEKGDFMVGGVTQNEGLAVLVTAKPRIFQISEGGKVIADHATYYEGWALMFEGESLAKLREQWDGWKMADLLRPIEIDSTAMTFRHLPSQEIFNVKIEFAGEGKFVDFGKALPGRS